MKYRIENGEAKIPLSELNRLNDEFENLKRERESIEKYRMEMDRAISDSNKVLKFKTDTTMYDWIWENHKVITIGEALDEVKKCYDEIVDDRIKKAIANKESIFKNMSVKEFKEWKRKL